MVSTGPRAMSARMGRRDLTLHSTASPKLRRRGGNRTRGGVGRSLLARLRPNARDRMSRHLVAERVAATAQLNRHDVSVARGIAECVCGWTGNQEEVVSHLFGGG
jgi:hypothetical protein